MNIIDETSVTTLLLPFITECEDSCEEDIKIIQRSIKVKSESEDIEGLIDLMGESIGNEVCLECFLYISSWVANIVENLRFHLDSDDYIQIFIVLPNISRRCSKLYELLIELINSTMNISHQQLLSEISKTKNCLSHFFNDFTNKFSKCLSDCISQQDIEVFIDLFNNKVNNHVATFISTKDVLDNIYREINQNNNNNSSIRSNNNKNRNDFFDNTLKLSKWSNLTQMINNIITKCIESFEEIDQKNSSCLSSLG